ncbi:hypothetical protein FRC15_007521 [Serendipita sp. 397]|nr:hypothetical protein FRC15_007521 [Serendipita sp. 397]
MTVCLAGWLQCIIWGSISSKGQGHPPNIRLAANGRYVAGSSRLFSSSSISTFMQRPQTEGSHQSVRHDVLPLPPGLHIPRPISINQSILYPPRILIYDFHCLRTAPPKSELYKSPYLTNDVYYFQQSTKYNNHIKNFYFFLLATLATRRWMNNLGVSCWWCRHS